MQGLLGKVALISGGTTGIGLAAAKAFVASGAKVVVAARNPERGIQAEQELRHLGGDAAFHRCDVTDPSSVAELLAFVADRFGPLNCAVNSAAFDSRPSAAHEVPFEEAGKTISTDVLGVFNCMKYEIAAMLQSGGGTIVNLPSVNGLSGAATAAPDSATYVKSTPSASRTVVPGHPDRGARQGRRDRERNSLAELYGIVLRGRP